VHCTMCGSTVGITKVDEHDVISIHHKNKPFLLQKLPVLCTWSPALVGLPPADAFQRFCWYTCNSIQHTMQSSKYWCLPCKVVDSIWHCESPYEEPWKAHFHLFAFLSDFDFCLLCWKACTFCFFLTAFSACIGVQKKKGLLK